jgi:hypothetical protein
MCSINNGESYFSCTVFMPMAVVAVARQSWPSAAERKEML